MVVLSISIIFRKMQDKKNAEEIYDLIAIRCILDTPERCLA